MQVHATVPIDPGHSIEFGPSTWNPPEPSVRNRYDGPTGRFSPHASSEMPLSDLENIVIETVNRDVLSAESCARIIQALGASIERAILSYLSRTAG